MASSEGAAEPASSTPPLKRELARPESRLAKQLKLESDAGANDGAASGDETIAAAVKRRVEITRELAGGATDASRGSKPPRLRNDRAATRSPVAL